MRSVAGGLRPARLFRVWVWLQGVSARCGRAAHVEALSMDGVCVEGVDGPCVRSWGDVAVPELRDFAGAEPNVVEADEPFRVNPI